jgi:hypothetical protein
VDTQHDWKLSPLERSQMAHGYDSDMSKVKRNRARKAKKIRKATRRG